MTDWEEVPDRLDGLFECFEELFGSEITDELDDNWEEIINDLYCYICETREGYGEELI